ncbi:glutathione transferase GstA [soil metagenome]
MLKLYIMPGACSLASHIALSWADADYELEVLDRDDTKSEAYLKLNPKGVVPTLVLDDGGSLTESLAVLLYIAERFPEAQLGAGTDIDERARLYEVLAELVSELHKAFAPVFNPGRFVVRESLHDEAKQAAYKRVDEQYRRFDGRMAGRKWLLDHRTVADAYLYVLTRWAGKLPKKIDSYPALADFQARLDADEGVKRALEEQDSRS